MDPSTYNAASHSHRETPRLCAAGCGFFGSAENKGLCSQCYKRHLKEAILANAISAAQEKEIGEIGGALGSLRISERASSSSSSSASPPPPRNRCSVCRRRLGLFGFKCRCEAYFCGTHRYPEKHRCTFDFKEAGKIAIEKENPICKPDKMTRRI